ncbi:MAG: hypothetical protein SOX71_04580 [Candidatus Faecousia sp.]|nr:hypothetical protein [Candidatus Faecousia sp.]
MEIAKAVAGAENESSLIRSFMTIKRQETAAAAIGCSRFAVSDACQKMVLFASN